MSDEQVCHLLKWCSQCGEAPAITHAFPKDICDGGGEFGVFGEDGKVAFVFGAAMLAAIRAHDTCESPELYVVDGFCSERCILAAAASEKRGEG